MRKLFSMGVFFLAIALSVAAHASVVDIPVTPDGDVVHYRYWGWFGSGSWPDASANPNIVYHNYSPGSGDSASTSLSFSLSSFTTSPADIVSASLNYQILSIWTQGRDDVATFSGGGTVYNSGGTGWKSFDITDSFKNLVAAGSTSADFSFDYTGYSGFTFSSAEGGDPAYLEIVTTGIDPQIGVESVDGSPVPEPATMLLLGLGLVGMAGVRRKFSS